MPDYREQAIDPGSTPGPQAGVPRIVLVASLVGFLLLLCLAATLVYIFYLTFGASGAHRGEGEAVVALRAMAVAQETFRREDVDGDGWENYATSLEELERAGLISGEIASGEIAGYRFLLQGGNFLWQASATPSGPGRGDWNFFVDESGVIRMGWRLRRANIGSEPVGAVDDLEETVVSWRRASDEVRVLNALRTIREAVVSYSYVETRTPEGGWTMSAEALRDVDSGWKGRPGHFPASLAEVRDNFTLQPELAAGTYYGYRLDYWSDGKSWRCVAKPVDSESGARSFYVSSEKAIRFARSGETPDANSPTLP